jgi:branched-chain amino acid transport system substrate-binding protein
VRTARGSTAIRRRPHRLLAIASGVVVLTGLAACGNSPVKQATDTTPATSASDGPQVAVDAPGVTATEIRVGGVASTTNPLGGLYGDSFNGVQAYFDKVNAEGGIYGRKLTLAAQRDDKLANNKSEVQGLLSQDNVFAVLPIATLLFTGADLLVQQNVPTFGWNINAEWSGTPTDPKANLFGQSGSYLCFTCASPVNPWVAQQAGAHKVGLLAYSAPQSADCADGTSASFEKFGPAVNASVVFEDKSLAYGTADLSVQVSKMKDAGVDFIFTCMDTNGVVTLAKELKKQGLKAPQMLPNGYDHQFVSEFGDLFEGSYVRTDFVQFEVQDKPQGLQDYLDAMKKLGKEPSENSVVGWLNADLFYQGLKAAGPNFSRQSLVDAINRMTDYTSDGLLDGVDWTKEHTQLKSDTTFCQFMSKIENSEFSPAFSQPGKPFVCAVINGDAIDTTYE